MCTFKDTAFGVVPYGEKRDSRGYAGDAHCFGDTFSTFIRGC